MDEQFDQLRFLVKDYEKVISRLKSLTREATNEVICAAVFVYGACPTLFRKELARAYEIPDMFVRRSVVQAWSFDAPAFREELSKAFDCLDAFVRKAVVHAWGTQPKKFHEELERAHEDADASIRQIAGLYLIQE